MLCKCEFNHGIPLLVAGMSIVQMFDLCRIYDTMLRILSLYWPFSDMTEYFLKSKVKSIYVNDEVVDVCPVA